MRVNHKLRGGGVGGETRLSILVITISITLLISHY